MIIDETMTEHTANLNRLVSCLPQQEYAALDRALRTLLLGLGSA